VITSVEFDHADIYRDLDHVKEAFRTLVSRMPSDGTIVAALDHEGVRDVVRDAPCRVVGYRVGESGDGWCAASVRTESEGMVFDLERDGETVAGVQTSMHGLFNVENNLAAIATLEVLGVPVEETLAALPQFGGVKRRLEVRGVADGVTIIDDFAHHPTAVAGSIAAVRDRFPEGRLIAVFEPRTNTSRRKIFQERYAEVFDRADLAVLRVVPDTPIYSATGEVTERFSAHELAAALTERKVEAIAFDGIENIVDHICKEARPGDVVLVMSNGDFGGIWEKLLDALRART
jgi:UDP-N-acetylmuramate: L-alanyl-gamma-D-glutamyl-meso-diaminopimelate ligase